jgi:hypothetical protein
VPSINPAEHQVHVYLEDLSGYDFFRANVRLDVQSGALDVVFYVQQCPGMSLDLFHRLQNHLVEFNLQERYAKQVNTFLAPLKTSFDMVFAAHGAIGVKNFLAKTAASLEVKWGINDWHVALIRGLEVSDEFCQGGFEHALGY